MIQQRPKDVLEIEFEQHFYYLVVLTHIVQLGGTVVYAFHSNTNENKNFKIEQFSPCPNKPGFNICTDLLLAKKEGRVKRIGKVDSIHPYVVSPWVKSTNSKIITNQFPIWHIERFTSFLSTKSPSKSKRVKYLSSKQAQGMDASTCSFDLTAQKMIDHYKPENHPLIRLHPVYTKIKDFFGA